MDSAICRKEHLDLVFQLWKNIRQGFFFFCCFFVSAGSHAQYERCCQKEDTPPPQPASLENNPKLLLILNSFVSRTTHRRPHLWVWGFVPTKHINVCVREWRDVGSSFSFFCSLFAVSHLVCTYVLLLSGCLLRYIFIHMLTMTLSWGWMTFVEIRH